MLETGNQPVSGVAESLVKQHTKWNFVSDKSKSFAAKIAKEKKKTNNNKELSLQPKEREKPEDRLLSFSSVVEGLPSKLEAPNSIPSTEKKNK